MAQFFSLHPEYPQPRLLKQAAEIIRDGGLVAYPTDSAYALGGHLHPGVAVQGRALQRLRLPAFWFGPSVGVLPAFGEFTGLSTRPTVPVEQVYAIADGRVVQVPM